VGGPGVEPCADVIVSAAARRSILVGGEPSDPKNWLRRRDAALASKNVFSKIFRKNFVLSSKFSDDLFLVIDNRNLQQNKYTAKMASAARRQIIGGDAPINKSWRRHPQIVGGSLHVHVVVFV